MYGEIDVGVELANLLAEAAKAEAHDLGFLGPGHAMIQDAALHACTVQTCV
jgi:hypothetical protein